MRRIASDDKRPLQAFGYHLDQAGRPIRQAIDTSAKGDHGSDPIGNGMFRMVPSGDVVDTIEMRRRLGR